MIMASNSSLFSSSEDVSMDVSIDFSVVSELMAEHERFCETAMAILDGNLGARRKITFRVPFLGWFAVEDDAIYFSDDLGNPSSRVEDPLVFCTVIRRKAGVLKNVVSPEAARVVEAVSRVPDPADLVGRLRTEIFYDDKRIIFLEVDLTDVRSWERVLREARAFTDEMEVLWLSEMLLNPPEGLREAVLELVMSCIAWARELLQETRRERRRLEREFADILVARELGGD